MKDYNMTLKYYKIELLMQYIVVLLYCVILQYKQSINTFSLQETGNFY